MIIAGNAKMTYTAVPKNACTSMKCFFYFVNTGKDFAEDSPKKHLGYQGIHHVDGYRMGRFRKQAYDGLSDYAHSAVIRDPIDRFISAFKNRLYQYNDIRSRPPVATRVKEAGLSDQPTLGSFVDHLNEYLRLSNVLRFHLRPVEFYLGRDLAFYSFLYPITETDALCDIVRQRCGIDVPKVRANEGSTAATPDYRLTRAQYEKLLEYTAPDYDLMSTYFSPRRYEGLRAEFKV